MNSEQRNSPADVRFRPVGTGSVITRSCLPCGKWRSTLGGTGSGIRWRCAACSKPTVKEAA